MERKLWDRLYNLVTEVSQCFLRGRCVYSDRFIALTYLWAVHHDRPTCWACDPSNWPDDLRPLQLPSQSTMSRRLRRASVQWLLAAVEERLQRSDPPLCQVIDAKPMTVGSYSKDPDAHWGQAGKAKAKGYKLHAVWGDQPLPMAWEVRPMNDDEAVVARSALLRLVPAGGGYMLGDCSYDENAVYEMAAALGYQLVAPRKQPGAGLGHRPHSPHRLRSIELLEGPSPFGQALYRWRSTVERDFGHLTSFGGGLGPLPSWVRRSSRVRLWVQAKLLINAVRDTINQGLTA